MSTIPTHYTLHVNRAHGVTWRTNIRGNLPNLYVRLKLGDIVKKTRTVRKDSSPTWDETLTFSSLDLSGTLNIQLKHDSSIGLDVCLCFIDIAIADLLEKCTSGETQLNLRSATENAGIEPTATLLLYLEPIDRTKRAASDVKATEQHIHQRGIERSAKASNSTAVSIADSIADNDDNSQSLRSSLENLIASLDVFVAFIDKLSNLHPYLSAAWQITSAVYKAISKQFKVDKKVIDLMRIIVEAFSFVRDAQSLSDKLKSLEQVIIQLLEQTIECCLFVQNYCQHGFIGRVLQSNGDKIDEFMNRFVDLKKALDSGLGLQTAFVSARILQRVDQIYLFQNLAPSKINTFGRPTCLTGTRIKLLEKIMAQLLSESEPNIVWLHGVAGSGKSTIALTIAERFQSMSRLGAFLLFERGKSEPSSVIRTMACELALADSSIAEHVVAAVDRDKNITSASAAIQFQKLLMAPLTAAARDMQGPIVVILDALDECGTLEARRDLIHLIRHKFPKLPKDVRFLVTSRPERDISNALNSQPDTVYSIEVNSASRASRSDVDAFIRDEINHIIENHEIPADYPLEHYVSQISGAAEGLFVWASTIVNILVGHENPLRKLKELASDAQSLRQFGLDGLYVTVLRVSGLSWDVDCRSQFGRILGLVLFSKIPLSDNTIDKLLGFPPTEPSHNILSRLQSVLFYRRGEPIRLLHISFSDYLLSPDRLHDPWFINVPVEHSAIAMRCFSVMKDMLRFNICDIETSYLPNDLILELESRVEKSIPPHLRYACVYWAQHLLQSPFTTPLQNELSAFLHTRLPFWLEVASVLKEVKKFKQSILDAETWVANHDRELSTFLMDSRRFITDFTPVILQSAPHIYLSALTLVEKRSRVSFNYLKYLSSVVQIDRRGSKHQPPALKNFKGHTLAVHSIAFSPDGTRVVSGASDRTLRVWEVESEKLLLELEHPDVVKSVAFSSEGRYVISGSTDKIIRVWDVENGQLILGPLKGHTASVNCVLFSPDDKYIISSSDDKTVKIWDARSADLTLTLNEGHSRGVTSIASSSDGRYIVSGSWDKTIRIWALGDGALIRGPFIGHTDGVKSIAFSPDGKYIVSGSNDKTVIIWDAWDTRDGGLILETLKGHTLGVSSVVFSPDGRYIISGSGDKTIRIWKFVNGKPALGPLKTHTGDNSLVVASSKVTFGHPHLWPSSLSNTLITFYSILMSIWFNLRLGVSWFSTRRSAKGKQSVLKSSDAHTRGVTSVTFSPNGKSIISGSYDGTVKIWKVEGEEYPYEKIDANTVLPGDSIFSHWNLDEGGWIRGNNGELLLWIPSEVRTTLFHPRNTAIASCDFSTKLDFSSAVAHGGQWVESFRSQ